MTQNEKEITEQQLLKNFIEDSAADLTARRCGAVLLELMRHAKYVTCSALIVSERLRSDCPCPMTVIRLPYHVFSAFGVRTGKRSQAYRVTGNLILVNLL